MYKASYFIYTILIIALVEVCSIEKALELPVEGDDHSLQVALKKNHVIAFRVILITDRHRHTHAHTGGKHNHLHFHLWW